MINESGILNINTKNLIYNYNFFKKLKKNLIVAPTIKANAYGLGDKRIYNLLLNQGCKHFFVATLSEGLRLNNKNKLIKIYVLNGLQNYKLHKFTNANLIPVVNTIDEYKIKYNIKQKKLFSTFANQKNKSVIFSLANAHGSIINKTYLYDMIRPGIGIYGCYENKQLEKKIKNVINFKGKIIQIKDLQKNQYIGYNRTFKTKTKTMVAIIGLGYEDGIPRLLSNKGFVYFKKDRFKIIGRISMDSFTIDISKCSHDLKVGMYVDIINDEHKVDKFAKKCKTISYEVLTSIGNRVYRNYE